MAGPGANQTYTQGGANVTATPMGFTLGAGPQAGSLGDMSTFFNQMLAWKAAQAAKARAAEDARYKDELELKRRAMANQESDTAYQRMMAQQQLDMLRDEKNQMVPIFREAIPGMYGISGGYGQATTRMGGQNTVAAGWVPASQAGMYSGPSSASITPSEAQDRNIQNSGSYNTMRPQTTVAEPETRADWFNLGTTSLAGQQKALSDWSQTGAQDYWKWNRQS